MSNEVVRNQRGVKLSYGEAFSFIAILIAAFSAFSGWIVLPEKVVALQKENDRQDMRLGQIESVAAERAETLVRIDERTKRIEEALKRLHP
jgi:hypothetical protein